MVRTTKKHYNIIMKKILITTAATPFFVFVALFSSSADGFLAAVPSSSSPSSSILVTPSSSSHSSSSSSRSSSFSSSMMQSSSSSLDYLSIDISEDAERNIMAFDLMWTSGGGILRCDGFKLVEEDRKARNVYATTSIDLPGGSPVLFVPEALILSSAKAMAELRALPDMEGAERRITDAGGGRNTGSITSCSRCYTSSRGGRNRLGITG